jgi:hypothetical protein
MLPRQSLRFLLADDPGAGKTIMAGLLIKELMARGNLKRCLIVCPGSLAEQWQDEFARCSHLPFEILKNDKLDPDRRMGRLRPPAPRPEQPARRELRDSVHLRPGAHRVGQTCGQLPARNQSVSVQSPPSRSASVPPTCGLEARAPRNIWCNPRWGVNGYTRALTRT